MEELIAALVAGGKSEEEAKAMVEATHKAAEGKAASILQGKKKEQERASALEAEKAALQAKIDELESQGLSEVDKLKTTVDALTKRTEAAEREKQEAIQTMSQQARNAQLKDLASGIRWMENVNPEVQSMIVSNGLSGIEDLSDEISVGLALDEIRAKNAGLIQAQAPSGTGNRQGNPPPSGPQSGNSPTFDAGALKGTYQEKMAAINEGWAAAEAQHKE